ncbi:MAG TPA: DUF1707 domain-containing protein [Pseudonocardiaceae bacterium]|nr:DUF1707 domain-containing protein [Pseudonocardiaceae bacterium]
MTSADAMRASDRDRERVVQALQEQVGEGRLTLAEFEERSGVAYDAKTVGELRKLTDDLPVDPLAPDVGLAPWQQPFPLSDMPPWARRPYPNQRSLPPAKTGPAYGVAIALLVMLAVVGGIVAITTGFFIFPLPLLFLILIMSRPGRRFH